MKKTYEIDMSEGKLFPKVVAFAIPLIISSILQLGFNAADLIVVGRFAGDNSLAAVGSTGSLVLLVINILLGMGTGTSVLVSRYFGAKDEEKLLDTIRTTCVIAVVGGILFGVVGILASEWLLRIMGTPDEVLGLSAVYLRIYFAGLPVIVLYNFTGAALRAVGDSRRPLLYLTIAGVMNVGMNIFFVVVFHLDVVGVALATLISQCISCFLTVRCLLRSKTICRLEMKGFRFSVPQFREIVRIGLPAGIQGSMFSISNVLIQSSVNSFGAIVMAGNSAAASIEAFLFVAQDSMGQAAVAAVSQNMGAREYERVRKAVRCCLLLTIGVSIVLSACSMIFRRTLMGIYTSDPAAIDAGCVRLIVLGIIYFTNGIQSMMGGILRGHGYSILPTVISLLGICVFRVFWIYTIFDANHTLECLYMSYPISWILTIIAEFICYFLVRKKSYEKNEALFAAEAAAAAAE